MKWYSTIPLIVCSISLIASEKRDVPNENTMGLLQGAIINNNLSEVFKLTTKETVNKRFWDKGKSTPLSCASYFCRKDIIRFLIQKGAHITQYCFDVHIKHGGLCAEDVLETIKTIFEEYQNKDSVRNCANYLFKWVNEGTDDWRMRHLPLINLLKSYGVK